MIAVIVSKGDDKLFSALLFQKNKDFKVYVPAGDLIADAYEGRLPVAHGGLNDVQEPFVWMLEPGALPDKNFLGRVQRTIGRHPEFDVYHTNIVNSETLPRIAKGEKLFRKLVMEKIPAPLSAFIFSTVKLREKAVFRADGTLDPLPTILACGTERGVRNVWLQTLEWTAPTRQQGPAAEETRIRERLDFLRWTESFYADDYPLGVGDRLEMIAKELVRLFPSYSEAALKEMMQDFQAATGPVRKMRASSALKSALKERQQELR